MIEKLNNNKSSMIINSKNNRIVYFDILNIMAIITVIGLHCNGNVYSYSVDNRRLWATSLIAECIFYWTVSVFVMLTDATLMKYRERYSTKVFMKKGF